MEIAREKGLPELKHHILPRTKGFTLLLQGAENRSKLSVLFFDHFSFTTISKIVNFLVFLHSKTEYK